MTIDISAAQAIQGWMSDEELRWLAVAATTHERIVEIGSWKGRSTRALGDHAAGHVYAVDHWLGQELTVDQTSLDWEIEQKGSDAIYEEFVENLSDLLINVVTPRRCSSEQAAERFLIGTPDMVFLDGEHAYEGVKRDIELWRPLLATSGLLCGHDAWHSEVNRAISEMVPGYQVAPNTQIWWAIV